MGKQTKLLIIVLIVTIAALLIGRIVLGVSRYFDSDEFAHLHWVYLLSRGNLPYRDIFMYHIPIFQFVLLPVMALPPSPNILIAARLVMFLFYAATLATLFVFTKLTVKRTFPAFLVAALFAAFPMTADKSIEIRPDMMMILFYLVSVTLLTSRLPHRFFLSGISFGLSVLTFPKILFTAPATLYLLLSGSVPVGQRLFPSLARAVRPTFRKGLIFAIGMFLPLAALILYFAANGILETAFLKVVKESRIVLSVNRPFPSYLALKPWPLVYVAKGGPSFPWAVNTTIWILSLMGLALILKEKPRLGGFFLIYFLVGTVYLIFFPTPYLQYFLPLSLFASVLAGITIDKLASLLSIRFRQAPLIIALAVSAVMILSFGEQVIVRVTGDNTNAEQVQVIRDVLAKTNHDETLYDMVGSFVFRPDGYPICCHPYEEFVNLLPAKYPKLPDSLVANKTKFIILDRQGLVFWIPFKEDVAFMTTHYLPSRYKKIYTLGVQFRCQNSRCTQFDLSNNPVGGETDSFPVIIPETYAVTVQPPSGSVTIRGIRYRLGDKNTFAAGSYAFSASPDTTGFTVQLAR